MKMTMPSMALLLLITGCQGGIGWFYTHPDRKIVSVDGFEVSVVPIRTNEFEARGGDHSNWGKVEMQHIQAIEKVSGCKVISKGRVVDQGATQVVVKCESAGK